MSTLEDHLKAFAAKFNPDTVSDDGDTLTDSKSGLGLTSTLKRSDFDFSNTLVIHFLIDGNSFQTWGCEGPKDEKLFNTQFFGIVRRLQDEKFEAIEVKRREARKIFKGL